MIRVVILLGKGFVSVGSARETGGGATAFHWQADKQGAAWRQEGHYQRLGQTEIRASFGLGRQASQYTHTHTRTDTRTDTHTPTNTGPGNFPVERLQSPG